MRTPGGEEITRAEELLRRHGRPPRLLAMSSTLPCTQDPRWHAQCLVEAVEQISTSYVVTSSWPPPCAAC